MPTMRELPVELLKSIFDQSSLGFLVLHWVSPPDPGSLTYIAANDAAVDAAGEGVRWLVGRSVREAVPALLESEILQLYVNTLIDGVPRVWSDAYEDPNFPKRTYALRCFRVSPGYLAVALENISEKVALEAKMAATLGELERSNTALDEFAYVASHDLKAPLRDIHNLATWIADDAADVLPPKTAKHLALLRGRIARMERLLDSLLEYSRAGRTTPAAEAIDVAEIVASFQALVTLPAHVALKVLGPLPILWGPRQPFEQVIMNLVVNALKHGGPSLREIRLSTRDVPERADLVELSIADDGVGVAKEFHARIFGMFQTLAPRDVVEGSGMGLALVKKLVEGFGGKIWIESEPGAGATFRFTWPRGTPPPEAARVVRAEGLEPPRG